MARVVLAVAFSITLMVLDHRFGHVEKLRSALAFVTYPLQFLADLPVTGSRWLGEITSSRGTLIDNNRELRADNLKLRGELQRYEALVAENMRLRDLLDSSFKIGDRVLIAELSAVDLDPYRQQVVINKGSASGAFVGQPVLDAHAVMGQVVNSTPFSATVLLITDPSHALPVQVMRNGLRTIAVGTGRINELSLPYLPTNSDIEVGDQLVTSGLGGKFPAGYPVAAVTKVDRSPDNAFARIAATPQAHLDRSREVLLVWTIDPVPDAVPEAVPELEPLNTGPDGQSMPEDGTMDTAR